jgi:6-phosphogluconolactonase
MQLHSFSEAKLLTHDLAERIKQIICDAITQRGHAYLVVSGGKTPIELFKILAQTALPWNKVTLTLADERCVPQDNKDSNEHLVRHYLLQHEAASAQFLSLYDDGSTVEQTADRIGALPTFDAVVLGMGEDGHTASLFPCANELDLGLDDNAPAVVRMTPQKASHQRVSLAKRRLLNSRVIFFHLLGQKKLAVLHQAMEQHDPTLMPVSAFLNNAEANIQVMYAP